MVSLWFKKDIYKSIFKLLIIIILFFFVSMPIITNLELQSFHIDENYWIYFGKVFKPLFIDKGIHNLEIQNYRDPPLIKYLFGFIAYSISGKDGFERLMAKPWWNDSKDADADMDKIKRPPKEVLYFSRLAIALFGIFTCLLIYLIGKTVFGVLTGTASALILAYNPLMLTSGRRAMSDMPSVFFMAASIVVIIIFYRHLMAHRFVKVLIYSLLIGFCIAFAAGTKLSGGLSMIIFALFCVAAGIIESIQNGFSQRFKIILTSLLISAAVSFSLFVAINPALYNNPIRRVAGIIEANAQMSSYQQQFFSSNALISFKDKFISVFRKVLLPPNYVTLGNIFKIPLDLMFFVFGFLMLIYNEITGYRKNRVLSDRFIIITWVVVVFCGIIYWIPLDWDRYYLSLIPCIAIIIGYCLGEIINLGKKVGRNIWIRFQ